MGYDITRFHGEVDEELICPICSGVLEEPLQKSLASHLPYFQAPQCEHAFCKECIEEWVSRGQPSCPVDRHTMTASELQPVPRILRNLLARLSISCDNLLHGCTAVVKLDRLAAHREECPHNPKRPVACDKGCGLVIPKDELKDHNCVRELRSVVQSQQVRLNEIGIQLAEQKREINFLMEFFRSLRLNGTSIPSSIIETIEQDEVVRWANSLSRARVTRWGGMISTPDLMLQSMVRRALSESGCPAPVLQELMDNAHERRWPPGLSTLETRQSNRRYYEGFVCKRIPGKQAVVVMACDNPHMSDDMLLNPGLVMIFAHGIE
ncbi:RNF41 [Cordylochernes scorpioides]|uniref:E3 ubiquitin-protein ligase NRDP1 n=1 Tax=Cordylochernes scorpioides TaxID=51811 RepID=A0ABY6L394_9ARAC|nr:RNF41 [Cordylochernes scorpioides]